jgi:hypothetical protein
MKLSHVLPALSIVAGLGASSMSFAAAVTIFEDNFDSHADGAQTTTVVPTVGSSYQLVAGGGADNVIQSAVNNGGNAMATTRVDGGSPSWLNGFWDGTNGLVTGGYVYTLTYDIFRANSESNAGFGIDVGYGPGQFNPTILHGTGGIEFVPQHRLHGGLRRLGNLRDRVDRARQRRQPGYRHVRHFPHA